MPSETSARTELSPELAVYVGALHDIVGAYHETLAAVTSPAVANKFLTNMSDSVTQRLGFSKEAGLAMRNVKDLMSKLGMDLQTVEVGDQMICKVSCPFASVVHPHIRLLKRPICPVSILALGAIRQTNTSLQLKEMTLTETGAECVLQPAPRK